MRYRIALEPQAYDLSTINLRLADGGGGLFGDGDGDGYAYPTSLMGRRLTGDPRMWRSETHSILLFIVCQARSKDELHSD
jgi:hypothetical protein